MSYGKGKEPNLSAIEPFHLENESPHSFAQLQHQMS